MFLNIVYVYSSLTVVFLYFFSELRSSPTDRPTDRPTVFLLGTQELSHASNDRKQLNAFMI